jgi:hypothetical protein
LNFFAPLFYIKAKGGKNSSKRKAKRVKTPTAMLRQAQHDKAQEASALAVSQSIAEEKQDCRSGLLCAAGPLLEERVGVRPYGPLKKFTTEK